MVKRIFKILGIILAGFVVVVGAAVGIAALTGKFEKEVIQITKIYFGDDTTNTVKNVYTLDDIVENIKYEPANATETNLKITVSGNDNGVIGDLPSTITAGKDFTIKVNKDDKGNNIGGVVTIRAISSSGLADVTLRVIVDVNIPDNALYFSGTSSSKITTTGKTFTMPISENTQYVYLKSQLVNAFSLPVGSNENLKSASISYKYYKSNGSLYFEENLSNQLQVESVFNAVEGKYNYYYKIPITTDIAGTIDITAKMHRTYEIQKAYEDGGFDGLVDLINSANSSTSESAKIRANAMLIKYNEFLNKYINYFDTTEESYDFFKNWIPSGSIAFSMNDIANIKKSLTYVFVTCTASIKVSAIKLNNFTSLDNPREYNVFDNTLYSVSGIDANKIIDDFTLAITTDNETSDSAELEKEYLYESLKVKPYLYLDEENLTEENFGVYEDRDVIIWAGRNYQYIPVYGFDGHTPLTSPNYDNIGITGYLLYLTNQDEYLSVSEVTINNEKHWRIVCNTPLPNDQSNTIFKALYLGFEVSGIAEDNSLKTIQAFTRIYVNYEDYDFSSSEVNNLAFEDVDAQMTINTSLSNSGTLTSGLYLQDISLNTTSEYIENMDTVSYTSVMYFAETNSNTVDGGSKVATVGKYKFINFINANNASASTNYYMLNDKDQLVGERIPTYRNVKVLDKNGNTLKDAKGNDIYNKQYYLHALNASTEPVKIFAVVYLSDSVGNPIDINGRKLVINESDQSDSTIPELVVIRISDFQENRMPTVIVNSYIDEVNFYTQSLISTRVGGVEFNEGYINRNSVNSYINLDGTAVGSDELKNIQDYLRLKLLKDNYFTLYLTSFELDSNRNIVQQDNSTKEIIFKDIFGKELTKSYVINVMGNKQIAFNAVCKDFEHYSLYIGGTGVDILPSETKIFGDGIDGVYDVAGNASMIKFVLHATIDSTSHNSIIYLNPEASTIPYSNLLLPNSSQTSSNFKNNWSEYEIHKLEINNLELDETSMYTKLFARYAQNKTNGELEFIVRKLDQNGLTRTDYSLKNLDNGNIRYSTETNLISDNDYNLSIVDCSQAGYRQDIPVGADTDSYYYVSIEDYINHYIVGTNGTNISYTNPNGIMSFEETYIFNNKDQDGTYTKTIFFGTKQFDFNPIDYTVNINGYILKLRSGAENKEFQLVINQGQYFPIVDGNKALIYNELFEIYNSADNSSKYIKDYVDSNNSGTSILVSTSANLILANGETCNYNPDTYIDDYTTASKNSAISVSDDKTEATVNFLQGEEIGSYQEDLNGSYKQVIDGTKVRYELITEQDYSGTRYSIKPIYEQDNNGNLYYKDDTQTYEAVPSGVDVSPEKRYSKKGVIVYLLVSFNLINTSDGGSEYTFYKALTYELVQEEIEIIGINKVVDGVAQYNSLTTPYEIDAGKTSTIYLNVKQNSNDALITSKASDEKYFFNHVTFSIGSTAIEGIDLIISGSNGNKETIQLRIPSLVSDDSLTLNMTYKYKGNSEPITKQFYIKLKANVAFAPKDNSIIKNVLIGDTSYNAYSISLNSGSYSIFEDNESIIKTYFNAEIGEGKLIRSVKFSTTSAYENLCTITPSTITLASSYAEYNDGTINRDFVLCDITLILNDGTSITLNRKFYIEIIPEYVVDLTQIDADNSNNITIFNNDDLFATYIRLFDKNIDINSINETNNILNNGDNKYNMFKITAAKDANLVEISGGRIKLNNIPTTDTTVTLSVSYTEGVDNIITISKEFKIIIRGVTLKVSPSGAFVTDDKGTAAADETILNNNIEINVSSIDDFNIDNYLYFTLSNTDETNYSIQAVLVDTNGEMIAKPTTGVTYTIGYA
ncbi:MAG: hypothetical protein ACI4PF_03875, partial [Christensenellales bacterium]